jgi:hypothetical protein
MDWVKLAQDREQWRDVVDMLLNIQLHKMLTNSRQHERLLASQEGFCSA